MQLWITPPYRGPVPLCAPPPVCAIYIHADSHICRAVPSRAVLEDAHREHARARAETGRKRANACVRTFCIDMVVNGANMSCAPQPNMRWEQAEDMYERVLEMDPRHYQTLCNYALLQV